MLSLSPEAHTYAQEAWTYKELANYYKYSNPQKHMQYYKEYYAIMQKLIDSQERFMASSGMQPAQIRLLHASPNAPAIDIYINKQRVVQNIAFKQYSSYISLPQAQYRVDIYPAGTQLSPLFSAMIPIMNNETYTVSIAGDIARLQLFQAIDYTYLSYGEAKIRFIHLSPDAPPIDVAIPNSEVLLPSLSFKQVSSFLTVSPGTASLEVRIAGTKNITLTIPNTEIEANKIYNVYIIGFINKAPKLEALFISN